ncbi:MAG: hypothetical protein AB8B53_08605 [Flavobacteriales bacterium]
MNTNYFSFLRSKLSLLKVELLVHLLFILPIVGLGQSPFQHPNTEEFHYFTSADIDSLEIQSIYELTKSEHTGGMGENVDLMEYYFSPAEGYYSANWFPIYDSTDIDPFIDSVLFYHAEEDYLNGSEWIFENDTLSAAGGHGYGTMTRCLYENKDGQIIIERLTKRAPYSEYGYVTFNPKGLPHQLVGWELIDQENEELYYEELESGESFFNYSKLLTTAKLDTVTYYYDENEKIIKMIENSTGIDNFQLFEPLEPQNYYTFSQCYWETEPLEMKVKELLGDVPQTLVFEISPYHIQVFKMEKSSKKYHFWNSLELY